MALVCITSHGSLQSWAKQQKSLGLQFHPQLRDIPKEFTSLPLLVALKWALGANPLSHYSLGQKRQCSPSLLSPLDGKCKHLSLTPWHVEGPKLCCRGSTAEFGFLAKGAQGQSNMVTKHQTDALWTPPALSPLTHLSPSCCWKEKKNKKALGVLRGYVICCGFLPIQWKIIFLFYFLKLRL